ncbi:hypothetical protein CABS01_00907 [Colletotrichum abscissum]|uniref:uncharacterized protein n=1 Tax=Colletotrichum abscissum TaxID=1671311 RepID=UPI0027D60328|nr:uncharacterized protein CABS01_00907 [Colletotrichum abscissum]KAK1505439.1 hypothetical protein CABS01_00907 [Colletotrichum abscissum]
MKNCSTCLGKQGERPIQRMRSSFDTYAIIDRTISWKMISCGVCGVESLVIMRRGPYFEMSTV